MTLAVGIAIIVLAIYACARRVDVRLALFLAALALGLLAGQPQAIVRTFIATFSSEKFVVPICMAMGFAHVLRLTGCDQHLVQLLSQPIQRVRSLVVPGAILIGFVVNIPIISQTSTAVSIGPVLIPLLLSARIPPVTVGAILLLGSSVGGELLNQGAPEIATVCSYLNQNNVPCTPEDIIGYILPLNMVQLAVATLVFWLLSRRESLTPEEPAANSDAPAFRVNYFKAFIPLLPLILLLVVGPPLNRVTNIDLPSSWLLSDKDAKDLFATRLIGAAMLLGSIAAVLSTPSKTSSSAKSFFEGAGYAFTNIVALIVTASCFGKGVELIGIADLLGRAFDAIPSLLMPASGVVPMGFAFLCGSGMASTQSLYQFFGEPAIELGFDPKRVGAVVSLGSAAGRTMSPVAAVALMCAHLTGSDSFTLVKRVALPLICGVAAMIAAAMIF